MRVGQKNKLTYRWARKGSRPRAAHDQRTQSTYLFGAVCPDRGAGAALVLPACNCEAMQLHLDEIATKVALGAHAIILLDQAGWHGAKALVVPNNISLVPLPPRAVAIPRAASARATPWSDLTPLAWISRISALTLVFSAAARSMAGRLSSGPLSGPPNINRVKGRILDAMVNVGAQ